MNASGFGSLESGRSSPVAKTFDPVINVYRWAVLATHCSVLLYFLNTDILTILRRDIEPLCWPYFESCWQFRLTSGAWIQVLLIVQSLLIVAAGFALIVRRWATFWVVMIILNIYLFALVSLDYRLRANEFYMLFWFNAVFLFWPAKRWAIPLILISFYFWAGTLKLNYEWLSGAVLYHGLFLIPPQFAWIACAYVVTLEMVVVWGLLANRVWVRWLTLSQFALFHIESLSQIHWFYPLLMAAMLSCFVIDWMTPTDSLQVSLSSLFRGRAPLSAYVLLVLFGMFQLSPYLFRGDKVLTGKGRIFALHMFEARQTCDVHMLVHYTDRSSENVDLLLRQLPPRIVCDPVVYYDRATNLCRDHATYPGFADADLLMHARRSTDTVMTTVIDEENLCSRRAMNKTLPNNRSMR